MRIAIVDDDPRDRELINSYVEKYSNTEKESVTVDTFSGGLEFIEKYSPVYDLIIMDIVMPNMNGLETAKALRKMDEEAELIFCTGFPQYAIDGYEVGARDYILKPVEYLSFSEKLKKAVCHMRKNNFAEILLPIEDTTIRIKIRDIFYIEVRDHWVVYHTSRGEYQLRRTLKQTAEELNAYGFAYIHNCYLVNLNYVSKITPTSCIVGNEILPVSRNRKKEFFSRLSDYIGKGK